MDKNNKSDKCLICNKKATGNFAIPESHEYIAGPNGLKYFSKTDITFRVHPTGFMIRKKDVIICPYCQMTFDKLPEYITVFWGQKGNSWYDESFDLAKDIKVKMLSKNLSKALKNLETLQKNILPKRNEIEKNAKQYVKESAEKRNTLEILEIERIESLNNSIINLLKNKSVKMPASDIDAFLKHQNVDEIKELCEEMYHNGEISRTANYRYFILTEEKKKSKKASAPKSEEVDVEKELEKLKGLLDKDLITQEDYDAKKKELLGL